MGGGECCKQVSAKSKSNVSKLSISLGWGDGGKERKRQSRE